MSRHFDAETEAFGRVAANSDMVYLAHTGQWVTPEEASDYEEGMMALLSQRQEFGEELGDD